MSEFKIFNKWETSQIKVEDPGLIRYINLEPIILPRTGGRNVKIRFWRNKYHIVERLINKFMGPGHRGKKHKTSSGKCTGKAQKTYQIVRKAFEIIETQLKKNPVEVFVKALENGAPREEITTIEYGGARYPQTVECSPQRRIDVTLRHMVQGVYQKSYGKKKKVHVALAEEIISAYKIDQHASNAIAKKLEFERQSDASR